MIGLRSRITQSVLGYFMLHQEARLYMNEMARKFSLDDGNLTRKLKELEAEGILESEMKGKERYYALNPAFPLLKEYKQLILKTVGFEQVLKNTLLEVNGIEKAILFGSYAANKMNASSDLDLLVIGSHDTIALQKKIAQLQKTTDREINVISMGTQEYRRKRKADSLLKSIFEKKHIVLL